MRDVLIIGAGIAGMSAAIALAEAGCKCVLISSMPSERAQSVMAEGGINAALNTKGQQDTTQEHYEDTLSAGCDLADPKAVRALTDGAPEIVRWLAGLGVAFQRTQTGEIDLRYFGGQKKQRTAYAQSSTGKQIVSALVQEVRKWECKGRIVRMSHHSLKKLLVGEGNTCNGCIITDEYTKTCQKLTGPVLLACGGMNTLFGKTTGTNQNTGAVTAAAFAAGAACANLEMIQYHPTTVALSGKRALISEAARGEGGRLFVMRNGERWYYMEEKYPELKNLMPRDVVSRETEQVCRQCAQETAFLDLTGIEADQLEEKLGDLVEFCKEFLQLDVRKEPIPVYPGIHYFMGGLYVDEKHRTTLRDLYAAGECACQYHGANRLGGNSLLGAAYGGKRAAKTILEEQAAKEACATWEEMQMQDERCLTAGEEAALAKILHSCMGIRRREEDLLHGAKALEVLLRQTEDARVRLALAMVESARARRESRGAQCRTDYPERNDAQFRKTTVATLRNGVVEIAFAEIGGEVRR